MTRSRDKNVLLQLRAPEEMVARVDAFAAYLAGRVGGLDVGRSRALRVLVERGLREYEKEMAPPTAQAAGHGQADQ